MQNRIAIEHMQVLKTLKDSGFLNKHQVKSIRGQILKMEHTEREEYLKKIIKQSVESREAKWNGNNFPYSNQ